MSIVVSKKSKKEVLFFLVLIIFFIVLGLIAGFWIGFNKGIRLSMAIIYVLLLPGLIWSYVVFKLNEISPIERVLYSVVISILIVPVVVFLAFKMGIMIILSNIIFEILALIFLGVIILLIKQALIRYKRNDQEIEAKF